VSTWKKSSSDSDNRDSHWLRVRHSRIQA